MNMWKKLEYWLDFGGSSCGSNSGSNSRPTKEQKDELAGVIAGQPGNANLQEIEYETLIQPKKPVWAHHEEENYEIKPHIIKYWEKVEVVFVMGMYSDSIITGTMTGTFAKIADHPGILEMLIGSYDDMILACYMIWELPELKEEDKILTKDYGRALIIYPIEGRL